jgi:hypothetical protein
MPIITMPRLVSVAPFATPADVPTYTDIYNATVGKTSDHFDGLDAPLQGMAEIAAALDAEQIADAATDDLGAAAGAVAGVDLGSLDGHVSDYVATRDTGLALVSAAASAAPPVLRELPMDPTFDGGIGPAPTQTAINIGPLKLNSAPVSVALGHSHPSNPNDLGIQDVWFADGDAEFFEIVTDVRETGSSGFETDTWSITVTPSRVGTFFAEFNKVQQTDPRNTILTLNLTVVP